ncbi:uncharacterized protein TNCV_3957461 [Trichonephila clavipes]|nr:uncharacterized protein TNCV_3957461 [Trichonephila clavipes]
MIFLRNHKNCSKKRPPARMQASHRRRRYCRTLVNTPGISRISPATTAILATRASSESTGLAKTRLFIWPQRKKSSQERSGERASQFTGQPRPIHRPGYAVSNALRTSELKCAGAPSCWNHIPAFMLAGTLCSRTLHPYIQLAPRS